MTVQILSRMLMDRNIDRVLEIEQIAADASNGEYRTPWQRENFLNELPEKWSYSRGIFDGDTLVGFYIASVKTTADGRGCVHGHRAAILPQARDPRLFVELYEELFAQAVACGIEWFTGYQMSSHPVMLSWYVRVLGCSIVRRREEIEYFAGVFPDETVVDEEGLIGSVGSEGGCYLIIKRITSGSNPRVLQSPIS